MPQKALSIWILLALLSGFALASEQAPPWAQHFWNNIDISDLSDGCVQRVRTLTQNAADPVLSPDVPPDVRQDMKVLAIFPHHGIDGVELRWGEHRWGFHVVATFELDGKRFVLDGGEPNTVYEYHDWLLKITGMNVAAYQVALGELDFHGVGVDTFTRPRCLIANDGTLIPPLHPVLLIPDDPDFQNAPAENELRGWRRTCLDALWQPNTLLFIALLLVKFVSYF